MNERAPTREPASRAPKARRDRDGIDAALRENRPFFPEGRAPRESPRAVKAVLAFLRWCALAVLALACIGIFYVAVILGETPEMQQVDGTRLAPTAAPAPPPLPGGARSYESDDIAQLEALLPARLATLPRRQGFVLESGKAEDARVAGSPRNFRVVTLVYRHPALQTKVVVYSAMPGGFLQRFAGEDFLLEPGTVAMASLRAMVLTAWERRYFVAAQGDAVYAVEGLASAEGLDNVPGWVMLSGVALEEELPAEEEIA